MDVVSLCPIRAGALVWQPRPGALTLTVVCKATFELRPGETVLASHQDDPNDDDNHWDDDPARSVCSPSDYVPLKPRADVLLVGHAFAPKGEGVRALVARLATSGVDKSIAVCCDRSWASDGTVREGQPFVRLPLRYERAAGGPGTDNPVGVRLDGAEAIPNLQPLGTTIARRGDRFPPTGFGPIAPGWPARIAKLGPHAERWHRGGFYAEPLPEDLDPSFFNAAPPDQQVERIADTASIVLENLSAQHPRLSTTLPGLRPRAVVARRHERLAELPLACDTLWIDTDRSVCALVWRGQLALQQGAEPGRVYVLIEDAKAPLTWADVERCCADDPDDRTQRMGPDRRRRLRPGQVDPDLPFTKGPPPAPPSAPLSARVLEELEVTHATDPLELSGPAEALPFVARRAPVAVAPAPIERPAPVPPPPPPLVAPPVPVAVPPPPPSNPSAAGGVLASSNAAAGAARASSPSLPAPVEAPRGPAASQAAIEVVDLLWFEAAMIERIRDNPPWRGLLAALAPKPPRRRLDDDAPPPEEPEDVKARRDVFGVLTEGEPASDGGLDDVFARAVGPMGAFRPPLALVAGDLALPFDELETLKATVAAVAPLTSGDKKIKEIVDTVNELLKTPWLEGSSGVAESLTARVKEAFAQSARLLPAGYLDAHTERRLLEQRCYQRRTLLGKPWLRALLTPPGAAAPLPTYLPADLATVLPMYRRFKARLIVELYLQQDQHESHPYALRAVALARVAPGKR
jgi:hypothetical protein